MHLYCGLFTTLHLVFGSGMGICFGNLTGQWSV